jgi:hypothetical protein
VEEEEEEPPVALDEPPAPPLAPLPPPALVPVPVVLTSMEPPHPDASEPAPTIPRKIRFSMRI